MTDWMDRTFGLRKLTPEEQLLPEHLVERIYHVVRLAGLPLAVETGDAGVYLGRKGPVAGPSDHVAVSWHAANRLYDAVVDVTAPPASRDAAQELALDVYRAIEAALETILIAVGLVVARHPELYSVCVWAAPGEFPVPWVPDPLSRAGRRAARMTDDTNENNEDFEFGARRLTPEEQLLPEHLVERVYHVVRLAGLPLAVETGDAGVYLTREGPIDGVYRTQEGPIAEPSDHVAVSWHITNRLYDAAGDILAPPASRDATMNLVLGVYRGIDEALGTILTAADLAVARHPAGRSVCVWATPGESPIP